MTKLNLCSSVLKMVSQGQITEEKEIMTEKFKKIDFRLKFSNIDSKILFDVIDFTKNTIGSVIKDISINRKGALMVSTFGGEIFEITSKGLERRYSVPTDLVVRSVLFDSKDSLWLGTEAGVFRTSTQNFTIKNTDLQLINKELVYEMTEASDGSIWMGLVAGGMRYQKGKTFHLFSHLPSQEIYWESFHLKKILII